DPLEGAADAALALFVGIAQARSDVVVVEIVGEAAAVGVVQAGAIEGDAVLGVATTPEADGRGLAAEHFDDAATHALHERFRARSVFHRRLEREQALAPEAGVREKPLVA